MTSSARMSLNLGYGLDGFACVAAIDACGNDCGDVFLAMDFVPLENNLFRNMNLPMIPRSCPQNDHKVVQSGALFLGQVKSKLNFLVLAQFHRCFPPR